MEDAFEKLNLIPSLFDLHWWIRLEIWQLNDFLETPEKKNDKEEIVKLIKHCRTRFKTLYDDITEN